MAASFVQVCMVRMVGGSDLFRTSLVPLLRARTALQRLLSSFAGWRRHRLFRFLLAVFRAEVFRSLLFDDDARGSCTVGLFTFVSHRYVDRLLRENSTNHSERVVFVGWFGCVFLPPSILLGRLSVLLLLLTSLFLSFFLSSRIVSFLDPTVGWWDGIHIHEPLTPTRDGETCGGKKQKAGHRMRKGRPETDPGLDGTLFFVHGKKRRKTREEIDRETSTHSTTPPKGRRGCGRRTRSEVDEERERVGGVCGVCGGGGEDSSWKVLSRMSTVCVDWSGRRAAFHTSTHHRRIHHQRSDMAASAMTSTFVGTNVHAKARVSHAKAGRRAALTTRCGAYDEELVATAVRARRMRSKKKETRNDTRASNHPRDVERKNVPCIQGRAPRQQRQRRKKKTPPTRTIQRKKRGDERQHDHSFRARDSARVDVVEWTSPNPDRGM